MALERLQLLAVFETERRVLGEKGVVLTPEAQARLDALPERFMDFIAAPERFFARPEAEAA